MLKVIRNSARETLPRLTGRGQSHQKNGNRYHVIPSETLTALQNEWREVERPTEDLRRKIAILMNKCENDALRQLQDGRVRHLSLAAKMELSRRDAR